MNLPLEYETLSGETDAPHINEPNITYANSRRFKENRPMLSPDWTPNACKLLATWILRSRS